MAWTALPVGRGKPYLASINPVVDAWIGGWQWARLAHWTSGLPFTLEAPAYPSNYNNPGFAFNIGNAAARSEFDHRSIWICHVDAPCRNPHSKTTGCQFLGRATNVGNLKREVRKRMVICRF
jgi:hypothetical protein